FGFDAGLDGVGRGDGPEPHGDEGKQKKRFQGSVHAVPPEEGGGFPSRSIPGGDGGSARGTRAAWGRVPGLIDWPGQWGGNIRGCQRLGEDSRPVPGQLTQFTEIPRIAVALQRQFLCHSFSSLCFFSRRGAGIARTTRIPSNPSLPNSRWGAGPEWQAERDAASRCAGRGCQESLNGQYDEVTVALSAPPP